MLKFVNPAVSVNHFNKERSHKMHAIVFISTVLSKIFYMRYVHKTKQKVYPLQKFVHPWFLILRVDDLQLFVCLVMLFTSPLFVLNS